MKIEYLWIEDYYGHKNKQFNFNSKRKYNLDYENCLINKDYCEFKIRGSITVTDYNERESFFYIEESKRAISEVTAIVGENGVGKSRLLDIITKFVKIPEDIGLGTAFIVILSDYDNIYICAQKIEIKVKNGFKSEVKVLYDDREIRKCFKKLNIMYYSNSFELSKIEKFYITENLKKNNFSNISTMGLIYEDSKLINKNDENKLDNIKNHFYRDFNRQMNFVINFDKSKKHIKFPIPNYIEIHIRDLKEKFEMMYSYFFPRMEIKNLEDLEKYEATRELLEALNDKDKKLIATVKSLERLRNKIDKSYSIYGEKKYKEEFILHLVFNCIIDIFSQKSKIMHFNEMKGLKVIEEIDYKSNELYNKVENIHEFTKCYIDYAEKNNVTDYYYYFLTNNENKFDIDFTLEILSPITNGIDNKNYIYMLDELENNKNYNFYNKFSIISFATDLISLSWPLSSGENNMLSLYARILTRWIEVKASDSNGHNDIVILLDEPENTYHPRWQQEFIYSFIEIINEIFEGYKVQIIFTTHSPILLSDIPSDNVIYLIKDNNIDKFNSINSSDGDLKTFAANIYKLYNNSFFLNQNPGIGTIGTFAYEKISLAIETMDKIEDLINNYDENNSNTNIDYNKTERLLENVKYIINIIGEEISKNILIDRYYSIKNKIKNIENKNLDNQKIAKLLKEYKKLTDKEKILFIDNIESMI